MLQGKFAEAEPLFMRCQRIQEKALGDNHPSLATTLSNRALLLEDQVNVVGTTLEHNQLLLFFNLVFT